MKGIVRLTALAILMSLSCAAHAKESEMGAFAPINGINLYYEIHGQSDKDHPVPLLLIHGGGSTIESNFADLLPLLSRTRQVIAIEEAGHGHTKATSRPFTFENTADDVAALLNFLHLPQADVLGFSNGGTTALHLAIRHPDKVRRLIIASSNYRRDGMPDGFFDGMKNATLEVMPEPLKAADRKINPDPAHLQALFLQDKQRMMNFKDISDDQIRAIHAPTLVLDGDHDVVKPEHALQLSRTLPNARLVILPSTHGAYLGAVDAPPGPFDRSLLQITLHLTTDFLDQR